MWQQINRTDGAVRHEKEWKQQQLMQRTVQKHVWCVRVMHADLRGRSDKTQQTSAYVSIRQHTSAYVSIRRHTSACVSMRSSKTETPRLLRTNRRTQIAAHSTNMRHVLSLSLSLSLLKWVVVVYMKGFLISLRPLAIFKAPSRILRDFWACRYSEN
jgi:hypothetical protein